MNKKQLSETDICEKFISPALARAGWTIHDQVYREFPLRAGRVMVRGSKSASTNSAAFALICAIASRLVKRRSRF